MVDPWQAGDMLAVMSPAKRSAERFIGVLWNDTPTGSYHQA